MKNCKLCPDDVDCCLFGFCPRHCEEKGGRGL